MTGSVTAISATSAGALLAMVSSRDARAGVLVRLPANIPAVTVGFSPSSRWAPTVIPAARVSMPRTSRLLRSPSRLNEAKKPAPLLSPMV